MIPQYCYWKVFQNSLLHILIWILWKYANYYDQHKDVKAAFGETTYGKTPYGKTRLVRHLVVGQLMVRQPLVRHILVRHLMVR